MVGRVHVGAVVAADGATLDGGVLAFGQLVHADAEVLGDAGGGLVMVDVLDPRDHVRRVAGDVAAQRDGQVDEPVGHGASRHCSRRRQPPAATGRKASAPGVVSSNV